jgi:hypothetical protein
MGAVTAANRRQLLGHIGLGDSAIVLRFVHGASPPA